jgi:hypothetical protein
MGKIFTQTQAIDFIEKFFGSGRLSNQGLNISVVCPFCKKHKGTHYNKKKFVIRTDNFVAHCWVCGYKTKNISSVLKSYFPNGIKEYNEKFASGSSLSEHHDDDDIQLPVTLPEQYTFLLNCNQNEPYVRKAITYLKSRGINTKRDIWYWKLGIDLDYNSDHYNRIIVPSFDVDGNLNYWTARLFSRTKRRYSEYKYINADKNKEDIIFNEININWNKELVLVEGVFDLFKCVDNAAPVLGSELNAEHLLFRKIVEHKTPIVLAFDNEDIAQKKQFIIAELLKEFDINVRILEFTNKHKNINDVGELEKNMFIDLLQHAKVYNKDYFLKRKIMSLV